MAVHQLVPVFSRRDPAAHLAVDLRWLLRRLGIDGEIYAGEVRDDLGALAHRWPALRPASGDLVLYHHAGASGMSAQLLNLRCARGVVWNGLGAAEPQEQDLALAQLAALGPHATLALTYSEVSRAALAQAGFARIHQLPVMVEAARWERSRADTSTFTDLHTTALRVAYLGELLPHERLEDLLNLHRELRRSRPDAELLIASPNPFPRDYRRVFDEKRRGLEGVRVLAEASHGQLVAALHASSAFVSMSERDFTGRFLLPAMVAGKPVIAYAAAAAPELLGERGIAFTEKDFAVLAEIVAQVSSRSALRSRILAGQRSRLAEATPARVERQLARALGRLPDSTRGKPAGARRSRPRVAIVVQRYGEVSGGAERHAQMIAEHLSGDVDLTILTTCARDHLSWENVFEPGAERIGGVKVLRFPTARARRMRAFNLYSRWVFSAAQDRMTEEDWLTRQGPDSPELLRYLAEHADELDAAIFFTYLYAPTALGVSLMGSKALVVPTAHDEPPLGMEVYRDLVTQPSALLCNTPEEAALIDGRFARHARTRVVGVGVEAERGTANRFRRKFGVTRPYLLYVGRIEEGKGIPDLLQFHGALTRQDPAAPELLLAGEPSMRISGPGVRALGRISDEDKRDGLAGALATVVPSRLESLSLLTLESFAQGTPVIAHRASDVLMGQLRRSKAGAPFEDAPSFAHAVRKVRRSRATLGRRALAFARQHTWARVKSIYLEEIGYIMRRT